MSRHSCMNVYAHAMAVIVSTTEDVMQKDRYLLSHRSELWKFEEFIVFTKPVSSDAQIFGFVNGSLSLHLDICFLLSISLSPWFYIHEGLPYQCHLNLIVIQKVSCSNAVTFWCNRNKNCKTQVWRKWNSSSHCMNVLLDLNPCLFMHDTSLVATEALSGW